MSLAVLIMMSMVLPRMAQALMGMLVINEEMSRIT